MSSPRVRRLRLSSECYAASGGPLGLRGLPFYVISMRYLITGATGFVGGHIAEACVRREQVLSAIVRPGSDAGELEKRGAILYRGELSDANLVRQAVSEADVVVHCAAKVGDWGPIGDYR